MHGRPVNQIQSPLNTTLTLFENGQKANEKPLVLNREAQFEERDFWNKYETAALDKAKAAGNQIIDVDDKAPFQDAVKPVWDKYGPKFADTIKRIQAVE